MKIILGIVLLAGIMGVANAAVLLPFDSQTSSVVIQDYSLHHDDMSITLDVEVSEPQGTMEISFERDFFDSVYQQQDEEFTIIADGDFVPYTETQNDSKVRTIEFVLGAQTEQVDIFGSHLNGLTFVETEKEEIKIEKEIPSQIIDEKTLLIAENKKLKAENIALKQENEMLDSRIFELENLVSEMETQVGNLNAIIMEQINVIVAWVNPIN